MPINPGSERENQNRLAWARRFQKLGQLYWNAARANGGVDFYLESVARRNYRQARVAMDIEEDLEW